MSLHYLVKLEMLIGHVLPLNLPDLNPVDYSMWRVLEEKMYKTRVIDLNELKQRLRTE